MSTKTIIYIVIGFAVAYAIGHIYLKGMQTGMGAETGTGTGAADARTLPTLAEIMVKGYNEVEAQQILDSLEAGRITKF